jgi:GMP synthase (glutamine-hydrolysing)
MSERETIVILDFGSQYSQLIARRVREAEVYCELIPHNAPAGEVTRLNPLGYILSGGPSSVYAPDAPHLPEYCWVFATACSCWPTTWGDR